MNVVGIREPDDEWRKMKAVWESCKAAGVEPPSSVLDFFDDEDPDEAGIQLPLDYGSHKIAREWRSDMREGLELDIADLPPNVTKIRFYCSW